MLRLWLPAVPGGILNNKSSVRNKLHTNKFHCFLLQTSKLAERKSSKIFLTDRNFQVRGISLYFIRKLNFRCEGFFSKLIKSRKILKLNTT